MESRKRLQDALASRSDPLFDPTLLAIAQGMLAPTRSGSFGEALSNVAGLVGPAQAAEEKRILENAQIRAELAAQDFLVEQQAETARQMARQPSIFDVMAGRAGPSALGGAPASAQAVPTTPIGVPGEVPSKAPGAAQMGPATGGRNVLQGLEMIEQQFRSPRPEMQARAKQNLELWQAANKDQFKVENRVVYDMFNVDANGRPRIVADLGEQKPYEITYKGQGRSVPATAVEVQEYRDQQMRGPEAEEAAFNRLFKGRRSGVESMPFGGERGMFSVRIPDPANPTQLLTLTGEATARQRALLEEAQERAFKTGDFGELQRMYTEATGQGAYRPRGPAAAPGAPAPAGAPAGAPSARIPSAEQAKRDQDSQAILRDELSKTSQRVADAIRDNNPEEERRARSDILAIRRQLDSMQGVPAGLSVDPELASLPVGEQVKITIDRIKASDKEAGDQMALIRQVGSPAQVTASDRRNQEILTLARENPKVFNLMARQGLFTALAASANEGFKVGQYSVSAPVQTFLQKLNLTPQEQAVARRVTMLLDEEFFNRAVYNKTVLGPQISNADATLMKSPMARPEDSAKVIAYWAQHALLTNRQAAELYNAAMKYPANRSPRGFIAQDAANIMNTYTPRYQVLQQRFSAGGQ
jgi:hypothetical protein